MASYSSDFVLTVATIAAKAQARWQWLKPDMAAEFAWFSVNEVGDAAIDDDDLVRHFRAFLVYIEEFDIPDWMI